MVHDPELLDRLRQLGSETWKGVVYRHMLAGYDPLRQNTRGARWNPPGTGAIYTSLNRTTALAEAEHQLAVQPLRPRGERRLFRIRVELKHTIDLTDRQLLQEFGITPEILAGDDLSACQRLGGAVSSLAHDGLLAPSARASGSNLVIFPLNQKAEAEFTIIDSESISE